MLLKIGLVALVLVLGSMAPCFGQHGSFIARFQGSCLYSKTDFDEESLRKALPKRLQQVMDVEVGTQAQLTGHQKQKTLLTGAKKGCPSLGQACAKKWASVCQALGKP